MSDIAYEIDWDNVRQMQADAELVDRLRRRIDEQLLRGMAYGGPPFARPVEVITDPSDRRGFDAKQARLWS